MTSFLAPAPGRALRSCALLGSLLLAGCGGGGSGSSALPAPGTTFPLQSALASLLTTGYTKTATISGTATYQGVDYPLSGTLAVGASALAPSSTLFAGVSASYTTLTFAGTLTLAGQTLSLNSSQQSYFTAALQPLGYSDGSIYCVAVTPGSYPATVQVGDSGAVASYSCYTDSSMTIPAGSATLRYQVSTAYSTTTATVSLIEVLLDPAGQQVSSSTDRYVISTTGALDLVSGSAVQTDSGITLSMSLSVQ